MLYHGFGIEVSIAVAILDKSDERCFVVQAAPIYLDYSVTYVPGSDYSCASGFNPDASRIYRINKASGLKLRPT
jgi:hypothetical protein